MSIGPHLKADAVPSSADPRVRLMGLYLVSATYAAITSLTILKGWSHAAVLGCALSVCLVLPTFWYSLRSHCNDAPSVLRVVSTRRVECLVALLFVFSAFMSWRVCQGMIVPDENAYRFEAQTLAMGKLSAPEPPGAPESPAEPPKAIGFMAAIFHHGWFFKYPIGWPLVLALPERLDLGWLMNPILDAILPMLVASIGREAFGAGPGAVACSIVAFSPYFLSNVIGRMSHGLCAVLIAAATLFCLQGMRTGEVARFAWMFLLLIAAVQVRPFTAAIAGGVLGLAAIVSVWGRPVLVRVLALGGVAAIAATGSLLVYNHLFTGHALVSPYAPVRGRTIPLEISASPREVLRNIAGMYRGSAEDTIFYSFPFVFLLAGYGWSHSSRSLPEAVLGMLFLGLVFGHFIQPERSASVAGERYWFEGFCGVASLAAKGIYSLFERWRPAPRMATAALACAFGMQVPIIVSASYHIDQIASVERKIREAAAACPQTKCVVFIAGAQPFWYPTHVILNGPNWKRADIFYAIDPGPGKRSTWTRLLEEKSWVVVTYNATASQANVESVATQ